MSECEKRGESRVVSARSAEEAAIKMMEELGVAHADIQAQNEYISRLQSQLQAYRSTNKELREQLDGCKAALRESKDRVSPLALALQPIIDDKLTDEWQQYTIRVSAKKEGDTVMMESVSVVVGYQSVLDMVRRK